MLDEVTSVENIEGLSALALQPGDKLVLRCRQPLSDAVIKAFTERIQTKWPDVPMLLVDSSFDVMVLRKNS